MTLRVDRLTIRFGELTALDGVTAHAEPGTITAVLGPNAAGKSTLLRSCLGLIRPDDGRVLINNEPAHRLSTPRLARLMAYVPQRSTVASMFTVRQVVELGRYALTPDRRRVDEAIERLDLVTIADRPYPLLSVGQQQRVTLARALAQVELDGHLVLDEPTSAMDLEHQHMTMALLQESAQQGVTVVMAMHDLSAAARLASHAWLLGAGRMIATGPVCDVLEVDRLREVFRVSFEWIEPPGRPPILVSGEAR